jgi:hypothetical protein
VANLLSIEMAALEQEQLRVVLLDTKHRILGTRTVYQGAAHIRTWSTSRSTTMAPTGWMNRGTAIRDDRTLSCGSSARRG